MHHRTLTRCLTALGLSACTSTSAVVETPEKLGPEPSGLDMGSNVAPPSDGGPRFVSEQDQWCEVWIDTHGRALEPTPSFLQAWNLVAAGGGPVTRYIPASPQTEDDARLRVCGRADCSIGQPQIITATRGGGSNSQPGTRHVGFGVALPSKKGTLVVPVMGTEGECAVLPQLLQVEQSGSLVHLTALVHQGNYARYYYHGYHGEYGPHGGYRNGGCQTLSTWRTDIVVDVETAQLELVLTQGGDSPPRIGPWTEVRLTPRAIELQGCADTLALSWTG